MNTQDNEILERQSVKLTTPELNSLKFRVKKYPTLEMAAQAIGVERTVLHNTILRKSGAGKTVFLIRKFLLVA